MSRLIVAADLSHDAALLVQLWLTRESLQKQGASTRQIEDEIQRTEGLIFDTVDTYVATPID